MYERSSGKPHQAYDTDTTVMLDPLLYSYKPAS